MLRRSSKKDPSKVAADVVAQPTEDSPLDAFTSVIEDARDMLTAGGSPSDVAARLWPRVLQILPKRENPAAELGRKGGRKGGKARAESLTPDERSEIARKAAKARWQANG